MRYAYAFRAPSEFEWGKEDTILVLSDVPVPERELTSPAALAKRAREQKLHAIRLVVSQSGRVVANRIYHAAFRGMMGVRAGEHDFRATAFDAAHIAGRATLARPDRTMGHVWTYKAAFEALIRSAQPPVR